MPKGRPAKRNPKKEWFYWEIDKVRSEERDLGFVEGEYSQMWFVDLLFKNSETLTNVINDSRSRSEVIKQAAIVANVCRQIAELEHNEDDESDEREMFNQ